MNSGELIQVLTCRWCGKKVIPNLETGAYPKNCPARKCRRLTWNKSDKEIKELKKKSIINLLANHNRGKPLTAKKMNLDIKSWLVKEKSQKVNTQLVVLNCRWCKKKIIPNPETGQYPRRCSNRECRRLNWRLDQFFCSKCELVFEDQQALNRHNERRNHNAT